MSDEYSDQTSADVFKTVNQWHDAFTRDPVFARLTSHEQDESGAVTEFFAQYAYDYLGLSPGEWTPAAVRECCLDILPRKVSAEAAFFEAIAPVLSAFFSFLGDQSLLPRGRALAAAAADLGEEISANARDRSHWGPAKHFAMAALDAGVEIRDPAALQAFTVQFNLQQAARARSAGPAWRARPNAPAPEPPRPKLAPPGNPYDPCPCGSGKKYKFCCHAR